MKTFYITINCSRYEKRHLVKWQEYFYYDCETIEQAWKYAHDKNKLYHGIIEVYERTKEPNHA